MAVSGSPAGRTYVTQEVWEPASMARRSGAWLIDMALLVVVVVAIAAVLGLKATGQNTYVAEDGSTTTFSHLPALWSELLLAVASAVYVIPLWRLNRATLGQRLLDMRVVDVESREALSWQQAAIRWLLLFGWTLPGMASSIAPLSWIFTLLFVAWFVVLLVGTRRDLPGRGPHDRVANSIVVKRKQYTVLDRKGGASPGARPAPAPAVRAPADPAAPTPKAASPGRRRSTRARPAKG